MKLVTFAILSVLLLSATAASGQWLIVNIECAAGSDPVSVFNLPSGLGQSLEEAGAALTVQLLDGNGDPISYYPAEDIWLEFDCAGTFASCANGCIANYPTNPEGITVFADPLWAGGWSHDEGESCLVVFISGEPFTNGDIHLYPNSADVNGDLAVDLADVAEFSHALFEDYHFKCDFVWDGEINLSDVVLMTMGLGADCP